jgi:hypothetical protein
MMQTFLPFPCPVASAEVLDRKRLGKQRVEAIQIARSLLGLSAGWLNHPVVKAWRGYESYLVLEYLPAMMEEWTNRGYVNAKCQAHFERLSLDVDQSRVKPPWITESFCADHRAKLIAKEPDHYAPIFERCSVT